MLYTEAVKCHSLRSLCLVKRSILFSFGSHDLSHSLREHASKQNMIYLHNNREVRQNTVLLCFALVEKGVARKLAVVFVTNRKESIKKR